MKQYKQTLTVSADKAYEACLVAGPRSGFITLSHDEALKCIVLSDEIIHGIEISITFETKKPATCVAYISVTGSMEILSQPRRMKLVSEIKRHLRNQ